MKYECDVFMDVRCWISVHRPHQKQPFIMSGIIWTPTGLEHSLQRNFRFRDQDDGRIIRVASWIISHKAITSISSVIIASCLVAPNNGERTECVQKHQGMMYSLWQSNKTDGNPSFYWSGSSGCRGENRGKGHVLRDLVLIYGSVALTSFLSAP